MTWSDTMKLPVMVLAYSLLAQLETLMTEEIKAAYGEDNWLELLEPDEQRRILGRQRRLRSQNLALATVELSDLAHKAKVLRARMSGIEDFDRELEQIVRLRNDVNHVKEFVASADDLRAFVDRLDLTETWITHMQQVRDSGLSVGASAQS